MSKIVITRPNEWTNRMRKYQLKLDGEEIGIIKRESLTLHQVNIHLPLR